MTVESDTPDSLPGLKINLALNNLQLELDDYISQLLFFARKNTSSAQTLNDHFAANEIDKVGEAAHAIYGVASTLGVDDVSLAARDIETTIMNDNHVSTMQLEKFALAMDVALESINHLSELFNASHSGTVGELPDSTDHPFDLDIFHKQVNKLEDMLSCNDFAAVAKLEEVILYSRTEEEIFSSLQVMKELLLELKFKEAKSILEKLAPESR